MKKGDYQKNTQHPLIYFRYHQRLKTPLITVIAGTGAMHGEVERCLDLSSHASPALRLKGTELLPSPVSRPLHHCAYSGLSLLSLHPTPINQSKV